MGLKLLQDPHPVLLPTGEGTLLRKPLLLGAKKCSLHSLAPSA
jgi:hypothetical protein